VRSHRDTRRESHLFRDARFTAKRGFARHAVIGSMLSTEVEAPAAFVLGVNLSSFPMGVIFVSPCLSNNLTEDELEFALAHEVGHIELNHVVASAVVALGKGVLASMVADVLECTKEEAEIVLGLLQAAWVVANRRVTVDAQLLAQREMAADAYAVGLQASKEPAVSCLRKLAALGSTNVSHVVETGAFRLPALTIEQRVDAVERQWAWRQLWVMTDSSNDATRDS
jgi:Zn-dependent protease with chaperone function